MLEPWLIADGGSDFLHVSRLPSLADGSIGVEPGGKLKRFAGQYVRGIAERPVSVLVGNPFVVERFGQEVSLQDSRLRELEQVIKNL